MSASIDSLAQLMHDTYETAAVRHGWYTNDRSRVSWMLVPEEKKAAMRDAVAVVVEAVRVEERAQHGPEAMQSDLTLMMRELGISTHARSSSPHDIVHKEILPKIRKMKYTLVHVRTAVGTHYIELKEILDEGRNLI